MCENLSGGYQFVIRLLSCLHSMQTAQPSYLTILAELV
jgi:hypothetical protein